MLYGKNITHILEEAKEYLEHIEDKKGTLFKQKSIGLQSLGRNVSRSTMVANPAKPTA